MTPVLGEFHELGVAQIPPVRGIPPHARKAGVGAENQARWAAGACNAIGTPLDDGHDLVIASVANESRTAEDPALVRVIRKVVERPG